MPQSLVNAGHLSEWNPKNFRKKSKTFQEEIQNKPGINVENNRQCDIKSALMLRSLVNAAYLPGQSCQFWQQSGWKWFYTWIESHHIYWRATMWYDEVGLPFKHPDFVLQGVFLSTESFLVDYLDCVHLTVLLRLRQPHLWKCPPETHSWLVRLRMELCVK